MHHSRAEQMLTRAHRQLLEVIARDADLRVLIDQNQQYVDIVRHLEQLVAGQLVEMVGESVRITERGEAARSAPPLPRPQPGADALTEARMAARDPLVARLPIDDLE